MNFRIIGKGLKCGLLFVLYAVAVAYMAVIAIVFLLPLAGIGWVISKACENPVDQALARMEWQKLTGGDNGRSD